MKELIHEWNKHLAPWLLSHGIRIIVIAAGAYILNRLAKKFIEKAVRIAVVPDKHFSKEDEIKREDTLIRIFNWASGIAILIMAVMMILQEAGIPIGPILAGAGIVGIAFGFGGQYLIRDVISGFFIILENQYRIGDSVTLGNVKGIVENISLRITKLRDMNGTVHYVPHGEIKEVSNFSKEFSRVNLDIGVSYNTSLEKVIEVINKTGKELAEDPQWKPFINIPPQFLRVENFGDSAVIIKITGETQPLRQWEVTGEFRKRIKTAFDKEGIEFPFPQRVIHHIKTAQPNPEQDL